MWFNEEFLVGIGTLALITAGIAQNRGRSGLGWFILGLFLGPTATFILVAFCDPILEAGNDN